MLLTLCFVNCFVWSTAQTQNFILIIVDDLRTTLGCYGDGNAYTPNIDRLAGESAIFSQAFAQQALCAPSRNSFLTSRRPDVLHLYDFYSYWRKDIGNFTTLPQHLKNNGYITKSIGKVFHPGISSNNSDDSPYSWSETPFHPFTERYKDAPVCQTNIRILPAQNLVISKVCPVKVTSMPNRTLPDIETLKEAKYFISNQTGSTNPFFLAVGFQKPHIPFKYPEKYLRFHPLHKFKVPKPYKWLKNVNHIAYNPWNDLRRREDVASLNLEFPWERIPRSFAKLIIQSYYASVTYIDDLIGKLINQLEMLSMRQNTTVILISDHGELKGFEITESSPNFYTCKFSMNALFFQLILAIGWSLGEHALWAKYNNYDVTLRVPLIISIPGLTFERPIENIKNSEKNDKFNISNNHVIIDSIVELVDIFPTVADLANITIPICSNKNARIETTCSEGITLMPLITAALKKESLLWKKAAFGQYPRPSIEPSMHPNSDEPRLNEIKAMGYTIRTNRYRYTAWLPFNSETKTADWNHIIAEELYDYNTDKGENRNVAFLKKYDKIKEKLKMLLQYGPRYVLPYNFNF